MTASEWSLHGLRILVTGGTGFVGSAFVRHAVAVGARVTVVAREEADHWRLAAVAGYYARWVGPVAALADATWPEEERPHVVVHCAAAGVDQRFDDVGELVSTNVSGTLAVLQGAQRARVDRVVHLGTSGEYGPGERLDEARPLCPTSEYGATRAAATLIARAFGVRRRLDVTVLRPFAVYGPYEAAYRLVPYCVLRALRGDTLQISSGVQTRDYVHVEDVAHGIAHACVAPAAPGQVINLCTGVETRVREVASRIVEMTGRRSQVDAGTRPDVPGEMWRSTGSPDLARRLLGWVPRTDLPAGLEKTVDWFRQVGVELPAYQRQV